MNVLIDPGHAPGNVNGGKNGYIENEGMWKLSIFLKDVLVASGVGTAFTRTEDRDPPLETRGGMAGRFDLFISQHSNAFNGAVRGVECFHSAAYPNDKEVAAKLSAAVSAAMNNPDRGAKTRVGGDGKDYYGVIRAAVAAGCPQVFLIENGYHDNELDEAVLLSDENLKRIALAQGQVILETLGIRKAAAVPQAAKHPIMGAPALTAEQLAAYLLSKNPYPRITCTALELAQHYIAEGNTEHVRGDIAFCQSVHETGWFWFGGKVLPEQNNYSGISGASSSNIGAGAWFDTPQIGVRAQIHHLKAYASTEPLKQPNASPRLHLVDRGSAPCWEDLNGRWAVPGDTYGQDIIRLYEKALEFAIKKFQLNAGPAPEHIIDILAGKVKIDSPDYWVNILKGKEYVDVKYLNTLFARFAGFNV